MKTPNDEEEQVTSAQPSIEPTKPTAGVAPMPGMPPTMTPDALQGIMAQQKSAPNYSQQANDAQQDILKQTQTGFMPSLARAGGGFADALMQGVARAGPSNFQQNITAQQGRNTSNQMEIMKNDPTSPLSKIAQNSERATLKALGLTDGEIASMPASLIGEATTKRLSLEEIRTKAEEARELHRLTYGQAKETLAETKRRNAAEELARVEDEKRRVKEGRVTHPVGSLIDRVIGGEGTAPPPTTAPGMVTIKASDGTMHSIPQANLNKARQRDPKLEVVQ